MSVELLNCPFCGGKAEEWVCPFEDTGYIRCTECEARTRQTLTREEAAEQWNTRAYEPDQARIAELEAALDRVILVAKMLQQNAEGCAINHYGHDFEVHGLPGWLADTREDIEAAISARAALEKRHEI